MIDRRTSSNSLQLLLAILVCLLAQACNSSVSSLEFSFRDANTRENVSQLAVTVVEPFSNAESLTGATEFINCSKLGFFRPTTLFDRNEKQLSDLRVLVEREPRDFPLSQDAWDLDLSELAQREARNPWQALLVYIEGRGVLSKNDSITKETLVAGCQCVRFKDGISSGNPELDELISKECVFLGQEQSEDANIELGPLVPAAVKLEPCRSPEFVIVDESVRPGSDSPRPNLSPGFCVYFNSCSAGQIDCVDCVHPSMDERCNDRSQVPVELSLSPNSGVELVDEFVVTNAEGVIRPEFKNIQNCNGTFDVQAKIAGRDTLAQSFPVHCVKGVEFDSPLRWQLGNSEGQRPLIATLPGEETLGIPNSLVALSADAVNQARISVIDVSGESLQRTHSSTLSGANILGLHGYVFRASANNSSSPERTTPLLAVVTGEDDMDEIRLTLSLYDREGTTVRRIDQTNQACGRCACDAANSSCDACNNYFVADRGQEMTLHHADMDADGYNDLFVGRHAGASGVLLMNVYGSGLDNLNQASPKLNRDVGGGNCSCYNLGSKSDGFEVVRWGGSDSTRDLQNIDVVFARPIGGAAQYARGIRPQGSLCNPQQSSACGGSSVKKCVPIQSGDPTVGLCLESCENNACVLSPILNLCADQTSGVSPEAVGYCVGEGIGCLSPTSFWNYFFIEDLKRGQFTASPYEDIALIGKFESTNEVRVFFGGTHNHVNLGSSDRAKRNSIQTTLYPRAAGEASPPSDARSLTVGDFNGDGVDDLAVLYNKPSAERQIKIWMGSPSRGVDEDSGVRSMGELLKSIDVSSAGLNCDEVSDLVATDIDSNGLVDIALLCKAGSQYEVVVFRAKESG